MEEAVQLQKCGLGAVSASSSWHVPWAGQPRGGRLMDTGAKRVSSVTPKSGVISQSCAAV